MSKLQTSKTCLVNMLINIYVEIYQYIYQYICRNFYLKIYEIKLYVNKMGPKHKCALNRKDSFCLWVCEENYPKVNLFPDVLDISILCRRTEEVPRTSIKSEFFPPQKENLLCCRQNSISYQSKYHFRLKTYELTFITAIFPDTRGFLYASFVLCLMS